jgi:hypothetical protein
MAKIVEKTKTAVSERDGAVRTAEARQSPPTRADLLVGSQPELRV